MVYFALKILWHEGVLAKVLLGSLMVLPFHLFDWHYYGAYFLMLLLGREFVSSFLPSEHIIHLVKIYGYQTSFLIASNCILMVLLHAANLLSLVTTRSEFRNGTEIHQPLIFSFLVFLAMLVGNLNFYYTILNQRVGLTLKPVLVILYFVTVSIAFFTLWIIASPNLNVLILANGAVGFVWFCSLWLVSYGENLPTRYF
ncbi:hypothetical protein ADIS_0313 [Lunatimonas lonarensis]|uniref:Uncharacterized protein n=1 Tax=Lunatimonas lonarensis TaxID=1232681 RepID=R7ZYS0_9BACT|nr:hypothetical protein [Lunatimonas lonarensis]EON79204.1 hypothetical protein ADIS_0313 [Lunatimonas lonarensis]